MWEGRRKDLGLRGGMLQNPILRVEVDTSRWEGGHRDGQDTTAHKGQSSFIHNSELTIQCQHLAKQPLNTQHRGIQVLNNVK